MPGYKANNYYGNPYHFESVLPSYITYPAQSTPGGSRVVCIPVKSDSCFVLLIVPAVINFSMFNDAQGHVTSKSKGLELCLRTMVS